jgi:hypothetical protein
MTPRVIEDSEALDQLEAFLYADPANFPSGADTCAEVDRVLQLTDRGRDGDGAGEARKPQCPRCGGGQIREFDLVPTAYRVVTIDPSGHIEVDPALASEQILDDAYIDELRCRDCDYASWAVDDFYPWESEWERAESYIGWVIRSSDGDEWLVHAVGERGAGKLALISADARYVHLGYATKIRVGP